MIRPVLTARQVEVLECVARGLTGPNPHMPENGEIAERLGCTTETIHTHFTDIYNRMRHLSAPDRVAVTYAAHRHGLIKAPGLVEVRIMRNPTPPRGHRGRFVRSRTEAEPESLELA